MKRLYMLFKRGHLWYYRLAGEKTFHTKGQKTRRKAEDFIIELLKSIETHGRPRHLTFRKYAEPFFDWDCCPHICRLREEGRSITRRHAKIQRQLEWYEARCVLCLTGKRPSFKIGVYKPPSYMI